MALDPLALDSMDVLDWRRRVARIYRDARAEPHAAQAHGRWAAARLESLGSLDVWWLDSYRGGVFLPFRDATSGVSTYGAGRYVLDTIKGADLGGAASNLVVDLNFAYQPSCAYDEAWACPLPGVGNRLEAEVPVGELFRERG
jgi:uncharacterized protein